MGQGQIISLWAEQWHFNNKEEGQGLWGRPLCMILIMTAMKSKSNKQFQHGVRISSSLQHYLSRYFTNQCFTLDHHLISFMKDETPNNCDPLSWHRLLSSHLSKSNGVLVAIWLVTDLIPEFLVECLLTRKILTILNYILPKQSIQKS